MRTHFDNLVLVYGGQRIIFRNEVSSSMCFDPSQVLGFGSQFLLCYLVSLKCGLFLLIQFIIFKKVPIGYCEFNSFPGIFLITRLAEEISQRVPLI